MNGNAEESSSEDLSLRGAENVSLPDFGPFEPPDDYEFEPELSGEPPRQVPAGLRRGRHGRRQLRTFYGFLLAGGLCLVFDQIPITKFLALFLLPLQYLDWIGVGCGVIALFNYLNHRACKGPYLYVQDGRPLVARILALAVRPWAIIDGTPSGCEVAALVQYRDPQTGEVVLAETTSNGFDTAKKDALTTSFRVGDYVTAVYLPSDPAKTLKLYGFLDLRPELGLVLRDGAKEPGVGQTLSVISIVFGFIGMLGFIGYGFARYAPIELSFAQGAVPFVLGGFLLGGGLISLIVHQGRRGQEKERRRVEAVAAAAAAGEPIELPAGPPALHGVVGVFGGVLVFVFAFGFGGAAILSGSLIANALLDRSPPNMRPMTIDEMIMTTHEFIFRHYTIKFHIQNDPKQRDMISTPLEMVQFRNKSGFAEQHAGWLGWPWIKALHATRPAEVQGDE